MSRFYNSIKRSFLFKAVVCGTGIISIALPFAANPGHVLASTGGKNASQAISWVKSKLGKGIDYDGAYGNQCVDLIKAYYSYLGQSPSLGNGAGYTSNTLPAGWDRLKGVKPEKGDILIYTGGYGGYGHVAIYESDKSHYHQNWNGHSYVERVTYTYNNVSGITYWGVIRPDFVTTGTGGSSSGTSVVKVTGITLNKTSASLRPNQALSLSATVKPSNATSKKVSWSSSDPSIAKVDSTGKVTAVKRGTAVITAKSSDGSKTAKCTITVTYTGIMEVNGKWVYVKSNKPDYTFTGVAPSTDGKIRYVKNGIFNTSYTGVASAASGNKYYISKGVVANKTCAVKDTNGKWIYVKNGKYTKTFTGAVISTDKKIRYVKNGNHLTSFTGIAKAASGNRYYMKNGVVDTKFTGYINSLYVKNGKVVQ